MSSTYKPLVSSRLHVSGALAVDFEQLIAFASRFLSCLLLDIDFFRVSSTYTFMLSCLHNFHALPAEFEEVIAPDFLFSGSVC